MLRPRIIPCLLVRNKGLVKTVNFSQDKYVGDPLNAVKIFNEKEVDEIIVLDIDATSKGREPSYKMIENLAAECRMPLCYGGGVKNVGQALRILNLGVEKVAISAEAVRRPEIIQETSQQLGRQSVVVVADVKKSFWGRKYEVWTHNASVNSKSDVADFIKKAEDFGAGEIIINSIDQDGLMHGYDIRLLERVRDIVQVPLTFLGGAGKVEHIKEIIQKFGIVGAAAGSLFVFKGRYRAVLINYPDASDKEALFSEQ